jgi:hypothetical protein
MEIGSDLWNARVYAGISAASELAAELHRPKRLFFLLSRLWRIYGELGRMNRGLDEIFEKWDRLSIGNEDGVTQRTLAPEDYRAFRDVVLRWHAVHMRLLSVEDGFPRNALMRERLARFEAHSERLLDLADWLDAMSNPEETNAKFDAGLADLARGDVLPWAAVQ